MAKTKVKSDSHGLYVRAGGYVFRPVACRYQYNSSGMSSVFRRDGTSAFTVDQEVNARHRGGTTTGVVKVDGIEEYWFSHGSYLCPTKKSDECWDPANGL